MTLRVQKERLAGTQISLQDYIARYQMTLPRLKLAKKDAMLMHPGPIIRGLELTWEVADCPQSAIVEEVRTECRCAWRYWPRHWEGRDETFSPRTDTEPLRNSLGFHSTVLHSTWLCEFAR